MKLLVLLTLFGCSANKAKMTGVVLDERMYFDRMVKVKVTNAPDAYTWIRLSNKQLKHVKTGDKVVFYVKTSDIEYEAR